MNGSWWKYYSAAIAALFALLLVAHADSAPLIPCSDPRGCPDLVIDSSRLIDTEFVPTITTQTFAPDSCAVLEGLVDAPGERKLLNFTTAVVNRGKGVFHVGDPAARPDLFEPDTCHGHHHFKDYVDYRLVSADGTVVSGHKMGFCLVDFDQYNGPNMVPYERWTLNREANYFTCDYQGISPRWADTYIAGLVQGQWIDVTGLAPGTYTLVNEVNPARVIEESNYRNNVATVTVVIP